MWRQFTATDATERKQPIRLTKGLREIVDDMRCAGITDEITHAKITLRHLGDRDKKVTEPINSEDIRSGEPRG